MMPDALEPVPSPIDDDSVARITRFNEGAIQGLPAELQDQYVSVQSQGIEPSYLLIYAEKEREDALKLHGALADHLVAGGCDCQMRDWHGIPVGERPEEARRVWLQEARLVLLLLSASLIADLKKGAITLETERPLLPLALKEIAPDRLQGTVLAGRAIFTDQGKAWISRSGAGRDAWVGRAADQILGRIQTRAPRRDPLDFLARPHLRRADDCDDGHYVTQLLKGQSDPEGRPAIDFLLDWLRDPQGDVFCAIFGELGMGKTTLCQRLTRVLLDGRAKAPDLPLPVYLDLRAVNTMGWDWSKGAPELGPMLDHLIGSAYNIPVGHERPGAEQIARLAQEQRGLILFDGLDEAMNRLTPEQCRLFIHRLWSILPPILWKRPPGAPKDWRRPEGVGRLVMTCRSHFFQSLQDQLNALDGQQREAVTSRDYLWVTLLPFSSDQVETYFRQVFCDDPDRAGRVIAMLDQVHDLRELGSRPYNLRLIQDQVEALEAIQREGGRVGIADLYEGMVGQWLLRDEKKHRINRDHKLLLMERLALRLWSRQQGDVAYADLNDWLMDQILAEPRWEKIEYRSYLSRDEGPEILKEDLRNATFIVREGDDRFRFAHTSIMEFFLARTLHRALVEERLDDWTIPVPSPETLDFLGGLITGRETGTCLAALARIRAAYRVQVSELALAYALRAYDLELPGADFAGFQLQGAALRFQRWQGQKDQAMDWRSADLSGVRLDGGRFIDCDFTGSRFDGADLARTLFDRCRLDRVSARGVDLTGAVVHGCSANSSDFTSATLYQSQWLCLCPVGLQGRPPTLFTADRDNPPTGAYPQAVVGHRGEINCLVASPDGRWLASAGYDGRIRLCDPVSGRFLHCLEDQQERIRALAVAPNGSWVASAGSDGVVRLWDPVHGRLLHRLEAREGAVLALAVAPDGNWLASATKSSTLYLWDPSNGRLIHRITGHWGKIWALAAAPNGHWLASASNDGRVRIWDPVSGLLLHRLQGHQGAVRALAPASNGRWLASAGKDGVVRVWNPDTGDLLHQLERENSKILNVVTAPDGRWLASGCDGGTVRVWDSAGRLLHIFQGHVGRVVALAVSPDGRWLASGGNDGTVRLWDPVTGRVLHIFEGHRGGVVSLAVAPNGNWLAAGGRDGTVRFWIPGCGRLLHEAIGHKARIQALLSAPHTGWLATAGEDRKVRIWNIEALRLIATIESQSGRIWRLAAAPDESWIASTDANGRVEFWNPKNGRFLHGIEECENSAWALAAAPHGRWLASAGEDGIVRLWDPANGRLMQCLEGHHNCVRALAAGPDGRWLAAAGNDRTVSIWDPASGRQLYLLEGHTNWVQALTAAPDGSWLASAGDDGRVRIWDPGSGRLLHLLQGHPGMVQALTAAPDGRWLASAGAYGTIYLWNPVTGQLLHQLEGHRGRVWTLAVDPEGRWLASAGADGQIRIWTIQPCGGAFFCKTALENLPESNWVVWHDPDGPNRRWVSWSRDAWRWLGWHAPLPDGKHWMYYPMDAFRAGPEPAES